MSAAERFGEALDCPGHGSCAVALCEGLWSLTRAVAPNKVWISCKPVPGAAQGCVCDGPVAVGTNGVLKSAVRFPSALIPWRG